MESKEKESHILQFDFKTGDLQFNPISIINKIKIKSCFDKENISNLTEPKCFCNNYKYTEGTIEQTDSYEDGDNLIIKGDNLLAMYSLLPRFEGKIKCMYFDILYNTQKNRGYKDSFSHDDWLLFMKNRLEVAHKLLSNDGAILLQCDDNEMAYLKVLCDKVFTRENFRACIVVKMSTESGVNAINVKKGEKLFKVKEYILYYAKSKDHKFNPLYVPADKYNEYYKYQLVNEDDNLKIVDVKKRILEEEFGAKSLKGLTETQKIHFHQIFEEYCLENSKDIYTLKYDIDKAGAEMKEFSEKNKEKALVERYDKTDGDSVLFYNGGMLCPLEERIVTINGKKMYSKLISDLWIDVGQISASECTFRNGQKPEKLLNRIITLLTNEDDIILDAFLGSGTTAAVAHKLGRRYIGIEIGEEQIEMIKTRLNGVINGDMKGISKDIDWRGGGEFTYTEIKKIGHRYLSILDSFSIYDDSKLNEIFSKIQSELFANYSINFNDILTKEVDFEKLSHENKILFLKTFLTENHIFYTNYVTTDDSAKFEDTFNNSFYKK